MYKGSKERINKAGLMFLLILLAFAISFCWAGASRKGLSPRLISILERFRPSVATSNVAPDGRSVWIEFRDGKTELLLLAPPGTR